MFIPRIATWWIIFRLSLLFLLFKLRWCPTTSSWLVSSKTVTVTTDQWRISCCSSAQTSTVSLPTSLSSIISWPVTGKLLNRSKVWENRWQRQALLPLQLLLLLLLRTLQVLVQCRLHVLATFHALSAQSTLAATSDQPNYTSFIHQTVRGSL